MVADAGAVCLSLIAHASLLTPTGDSRSILVRKSGVVALSWDHKPYNEGEKKRIEAACGSVSAKRVNGDLAVSRALGDFSYKQSFSLPAEQQQVCMCAYLPASPVSGLLT